MNFEQQMEALRLRLQLLKMNLELAIHQDEAQTRQLASLLKLAQQDGENIRELARFAETHRPPNRHA